MAIGTYSELQSAITSFPDRPDLATADVKNMIQLAEARLNRLLKTVETEATLTGTAGSRTISLASLTILEPIALKLILSSDGDERDVILKPYGEIDYVDDNGEPDYAEIVGTSLRFQCPLDEAYEFRFVYRGRFALSDAAPTNKLLTESPDVYLAACIVWGGIFTQDEASVSLKGILDEFVREARVQLAQMKRTQMSLPPMISALGRQSRSGNSGSLDFVGYGDDVVYYDEGA